jgi:hypothetical protein
MIMHGKPAIKVDRGVRYVCSKEISGCYCTAVNAVDAREGNPYSDPLKSSVHEPIAKDPGFGEYELMTPRLDLTCRIAKDEYR